MKHFMLRIFKYCFCPVRFSRVQNAFEGVEYTRALDCTEPGK